MSNKEIERDNKEKIKLYKKNSSKFKEIRN